MDGRNEIGCDLFVRVGKITESSAEVHCTLDTSVVDKDIEITELGRDLLHQRPTRSGFRNIADANGELRDLFLCGKQALPTTATDDNHLSR